MKKRFVSVLLAAMLFLSAACTAETPESVPDSKQQPASSAASVLESSEPAGTSEPEKAASSAGAAGDGAYLYVGGLVYETIEFTVDNDFNMEDHTGDYISTGGGDVHMPSGATMKPGSRLKGDNMIQITELTEYTPVAFSFKTELEEDDLAAALDRFVSENLLDDGSGPMKPVCYLYGDDFICLLFDTDRLEGKEVWFRLADGADTVIAPQD